MKQYSSAVIIKVIKIRNDPDENFIWLIVSLDNHFSYGKIRKKLFIFNIEDHLNLKKQTLDVVSGSFVANIFMQ
jgi:hypothetical protein